MRRLLLLLTGLLCAGPLHAAETVVAAEPARANTVALLYFDVAGGDESLAVLRKGMAQMLIADLAEVPAAILVERDQLQAILTEQKLDRDLKMDAKTSARVGKLLGARYLVLGMMFSVKDRLAVTAKVVDVETGQVTQGVTKDGKLDDFLSIEQELAGALRIALGKLPPPSRAQRPTPTVRRERPKPPAKLPMTSAVRYAKALDLHDRGQDTEARTELKAVLAQHPDFALAAVDLQKLMR